MIIKKLSTSKNASQINKTLVYVLQKSSITDTSKRITAGVPEFAKFLSDKIEQRRVSRQKTLASHFVVSFHPSDDVDQHSALEITKSIFEKQMGLNRNYTFAVHADTDHLHVHAVLELRDNSKKVYNKLNDFREFEALAAKAEIKYGLYKVNRTVLSSSAVGAPVSNPLNSTHRLEKRTGQYSEKRKLLLQLKPEEFKRSDDFLSALIVNDFNIKTRLNGQKFCGYTIEKDGQEFKASELGISVRSMAERYSESESSIILSLIAYSKIFLEGIAKKISHSVCTSKIVKPTIDEMNYSSAVLKGDVASKIDHEKDPLYGVSRRRPSLKPVNKNGLSI